MNVEKLNGKGTLEMNRVYHFIVNTAARTGKGIFAWNELEEILMQRQIKYETHLTEYAGHAKTLARELSETGTESDPVYLVIVGGDGTVNEVLNGIVNFENVRFGYVPNGSANDLANGLGWFKFDAKEILNKLLDGEYHGFAMDLGCSTDESGNKNLFAISSGIGIDAEVCKAALHSKLKKFLNVIHLGGLTYKLLTIHKLFTMPHVTCYLKLDDQPEKMIQKGIFAVGMNQPVEGGGVPMAPKAVCTDGKLTLCCVYGYSRFRAFFVLPSLLAGKHEGKKGFWIESFSKATIRLESAMVLHADGEYCGEQKHVCIECLPGIMKFI
ncbi:MAG: diacylglycerol kinase family lipid kinase [Agathobacter sp.]|uniref:diacylglycerol/lipid kinase family protein n=1 Tax=Agathobacter sp. TaxID=2021311 RepID=UPI00258801E1|nr:diacylglycerol kinase family protein [Agathobacter sp.]MCR5677996.1 diacylglycerol kinase family lipid kinase [Agathobacter sp.]